MAQHDFDVANGTGAAVRADLNDALEALATLSGGSSAPSTTYAHQWWFDESVGILKVRNSANTAWVNVAVQDTAGWATYHQGALLNSSGTWTPVITFDTPGDLNVVYSAQQGHYNVIGDMVFVQATLATSTFTHGTASGQLRVTGLPFTSANDTLAFWRGSGTWRGVTKTNYTQVTPTIRGNVSYVEFAASGSGQANADVLASDMPSGGTVVLGVTIVYRKA